MSWIDKYYEDDAGFREVFIAPVLVCGDREFVAKHYEYRRAA